MILGSVTLPNASYVVVPSAKQVIHEYDWSDECAVTDMGSGPTIITVTGYLDTEAERLDVIGACEDARQVETYLFFPSAQGGSDDYYYRVQTGPAKCTSVDKSLDLWAYEFKAVALVPYIYSASTGERVT